MTTRQNTFRRGNEPDKKGPTAAAMRTRGYDDGIIPGREPRHPDSPIYMASFKRGRESYAARKKMESR